MLKQIFYSNPALILNFLKLAINPTDSQGLLQVFFFAILFYLKLITIFFFFYSFRDDCLYLLHSIGNLHYDFYFIIMIINMINSLFNDHLAQKSRFHMLPLLDLFNLLSR